MARQPGWASLGLRSIAIRMPDESRVKDSENTSDEPSENGDGPNCRNPVEAIPVDVDMDDSPEQPNDEA